MVLNSQGEVEKMVGIEKSDVEDDEMEDSGIWFTKGGRLEAWLHT